MNCTTPQALAANAPARSDTRVMDFIHLEAIGRGIVLMFMALLAAWSQQLPDGAFRLHGILGPHS